MNKINIINVKYTTEEHISSEHFQNKPIKYDVCTVAFLFMNEINIVEYEQKKCEKHISVCNRGNTILRHGGLHTNLNQCIQGS